MTMKKRFLWLAAILTICGAAMFTSCNEYDNPSGIPNGPGTLVGYWYDEYETDGVLPTGETFTKVVQYAAFYPDGTGIWFKMMLNGLNVLDGDHAYFGGNFEYTANADGEVTIKVTDLKTTDAKASFWKMHFVDGKLHGSDGNELYDMEPATEEQITYAQQLMSDLLGGGDSYNINDYTITYGGKTIEPFTRDNWDKRESIFLFEGGTGNSKIKDTNGDGGYEDKNLPWSEEESENHIPQDIIDETTRANGWELVLNTCGSRNVRNENFFAVYHKMTGVLRFFIFIPPTFQTSGSDHLYEVQMSDRFSSRAVFTYGIPSDRKISNKSAMGQKGEMSIMSTPWIASNADVSIGRNTMAPGWWAVDVDLSLYRSSDKTDITDKDGFAVKVRAFKSEEVKLTSDLVAKATGNLDLKQTHVSTEGGIFTPLEDFLGQIGDVKELFDDATKIYGQMSTGDVFDGVKGSVSLAKKGLNLIGVDTGEKKEGFEGYKGTLNMDLKGTLTTSGVIQSASAVSNMVTPTFRKGNFDLANNPTLFEGVWNIKKTPKVYVVDDVVVDWRRQDNDIQVMSSGHDYGNLNNLAYPEGYRSPFDGAANVYPYFYNQGAYGYANADTKPFHGRICVFDPSTIEVELNPRLFDPSDVEDIQVQAVCGVRSSQKFGSTDPYRLAQGLKGSQVDFGKYTPISDRPLTEAAFDGLYAFDTEDIPNRYVTGAKFAEQTYNNRKVGVFGRGDSEYIIEAMGLIGGKDNNDWDYYILPPYEISVTVAVKLASQDNPVILTRKYLPEFEVIQASKLASVYDNAKAVNKNERHYTRIYDNQVAHIQSIRAWIARTPISLNSIQTAYDHSSYHEYPNEWDPEWQSGYTLIDGNTSTYWYSRRGSRSYNSANLNYSNKSGIGDWTCSWLEFSTIFRNTPKSFTVTCGPHTGRIPQNIRLLASDYAASWTARDWSDKHWKEIYWEEYFNHRLPARNGASVVCEIPADKQGAYNLYRFECSGNAIDYSLAEITLNYE